MSPHETARHDRFLRLFTANEAAVRAYVRSLVPTRDDAREIMQEAAIVLWRKFGDYATEEDFRKWAFGVAKFCVLAWRRDKARDRLVLGEEAMELVAAHAAEHEDRLAVQREALEDCVARLPAAQRDLLGSAYAPGARIDRVAAEHGRTAMALYKTLHRLRLVLIDCTREALREGGRA